METPLAPSTKVMTPWAKTFVAAKAASRMGVEYCILIYMRNEVLEDKDSILLE